MTGRRLAPVLPALVAGALLVGCGSDDDAGRFDDDVEEVRAAVDAGDHGRARQALDALAVDAFAAHQEGEIDRAELEEVAQLIASASEAVDQMVEPAPTTTTSPPSTAPPETSEQDGEKDEDDEKDEDEKKKDKDDDDD